MSNKMLNEFNFSLLFVCLGNICRSPSAEAVMKSILKNNDKALTIYCDSAGVMGYHSGEPADARMRKHALKRNILIDSISRQIKVADFSTFDLIIGMDNQNMLDLKQLCPPEVQYKLKKMTDYCSKLKYDSVPDPYYGGDASFELVLDILEDACNGLFQQLIAQKAI